MPVAPSCGPLATCLLICGTRYKALSDQCERDLRSSYARMRLGGRPRSLFVLPILSRGTARPPWSTDVSAVPSHGRRVHSEARVVLAVSRAVSPLKKAIPPYTTSASAHLIAPCNDLPKKRNPSFPASSTRGPHCLLVTVVVFIVVIVHQRTS